MTATKGFSRRLLLRAAAVTAAFGRRLGEDKEAAEAAAARLGIRKTIAEVRGLLPARGGLPANRSLSADLEKKLEDDYMAAWKAQRMELKRILHGR